MGLSPKDKSIRSHWATYNATRAIILNANDAYKSFRERSPNLGTPPEGLPIVGDTLPEAPKPQPPRSVGLPTPSDSPNVCIVGAGAAGLFTGLLFDHLNLVTDGAFKVNYDILEAAGPDRVGGRLFTYYFKKAEKKKEKEELNSHLYYDVGAMRFPDNPIMSRTFALFHYLDMEKKPLSEARTGDLVENYMTGEGKEPWCYNDITTWGVPDTLFATGIDTFKMNKEGCIPKDVYETPPGTVISYSYAQIKEMLKKLGQNVWYLLMSLDKLSMRQYLSGWTSGYDQAFSELVLASLDFDYDKNTKWYCVMGGAQQLAVKMQSKLTTKPQFKTRVTAFTNESHNQMRVFYKNSDGIEQNKRYRGVFNSTTLGALQQIDTSNANLSYTMKQAIRSLGYGAASKVGIKFGKPWWQHCLGEGYNIKKAGLGHSDMTIRTCVYPSYSIEDPKNEPAVLLCSYTWGQDASREGSLIAGDSNPHPYPGDQGLFKNILIRDLARMHMTPERDYKTMHKIISDSYIEHHAYDWYADPNTLGAFAFFRPQQFSSMWGKIIQPTKTFAIIGEAASPHHAWVVGALESVVHSVYVWLGTNIDIPGAEQARKYLEGQESETDPFVGLPPYMESNMANWQTFVSTAMSVLNEKEK